MSLGNKYVLVGAGGVGTHAMGAILRYLAHTKQGAEVLVIDPDDYEYKNRERQEFKTFGNKAVVKVQEYEDLFPELNIRAISEYVTTSNVASFVEEGTVVFSMADNHATRLVLNDHIASLKDGLLISGGNNFHDGNVQVFLRQEDKDVTPPLTHLHPEIAEPVEKHPAELSCEERAAQGTPQLGFANMAVATFMSSTLWVVDEALKLAEQEQKPLDLPYNEMFFDLKTGRVRPVKRRWNNDDTETGDRNVEPAGDHGKLDAAPGEGDG